MNSFDLSWILVLEAVLPFLVLSIVLIMALMAGRKKLKQAAKLLILNVKANEAKEKQAIITFLKDKLASEETTAKKNAKKIMNERKFLVRNLVSGILDKNIETIGQINDDLCRISDLYHKLNVATVAEEEADEDLSEDATEELSELKSEIKSLKQEVHITLTTLNNIFKEFSSMFGEDDIPEGTMTVDQIITAMESFSGKSASTEQEDSESDDSESDDEVEPESEAEEEVESESEPDPELDLDFKSEGDSEDSSEVEQEGSAEEDDLDFSVDSAIDDIDSALDELELGESDTDDEEPDWGDAFAESGDEMGKGEQ